MGKMLKAKIKNKILDSKEAIIEAKEAVQDFVKRRKVEREVSSFYSYATSAEEMYNRTWYNDSKRTEEKAKSIRKDGLEKIANERQEIRGKRLEALEKQKSENIRKATEVEFEAPSVVEEQQIEEAPSIADVEKEKTE